MGNITKKGFRFENYKVPEQTPFDKLFEIFKELITHTSGDVDEALDWTLFVCVCMCVCA